MHFSRFVLTAPCFLVFGLVACGACSSSSSDAGGSVTVEAGASAEASIAIGSDGSTSTNDSSVLGPACGASDAKPGFVANRNVTWTGGGKGSYAYFLPSTYDGHTVLPVVFAFHGDGGDGASMRGAGLETATAGGAIIVYPNGPNQTWDLDDLPPNNPDYVLYQTIVADIKTNLCVDPNRIFAFGFSRGAFFVNQLGCFLPERPKGVAANSGGGPYSNDPSAVYGDGKYVCPYPSVAALVIHGMNDTSIDTGVPYTAGQDSVTHYTYYAQCQKTTQPWDPSPCVKYDGCDPAKPVVWCFIPGMGHQIWQNSAQAAWKFFTALP